MTEYVLKWRSSDNNGVEIFTDIEEALNAVRELGDTFYSIETFESYQKRKKMADTLGFFIMKNVDIAYVKALSAIALEDKKKD